MHGVSVGKCVREVRADVKRSVGVKGSAGGKYGECREVCWGVNRR